MELQFTDWLSTRNCGFLFLRLAVILAYSLVMPLAMANPPVISLEGIELTPIATNELAGSLNNEGLYRATINGKEVFIKVYSHDPYRNTDINREFSIGKTVHQAGYGPEYLGVAKLNGQEAIITEFMPGTHIQLREDLFKNLDALPTNLREQIREIVDWLVANKIEPKDIQFRMSPEGKLQLIDLSFFLYRPEASAQELRKVATQTLADLYGGLDVVRRGRAGLSNSAQNFEKSLSLAFPSAPGSRVRAAALMLLDMETSTLAPSSKAAFVMRGLEFIADMVLPIDPTIEKLTGYDYVGERTKALEAAMPKILELVEASGSAIAYSKGYEQMVEQMVAYANMDQLSGVDFGEEFEAYAEECFRGFSDISRGSRGSR